jgi:hypothetical protein
MGPAAGSVIFARPFAEDEASAVAVMDTVMAFCGELGGAV